MCPYAGKAPMWAVWTLTKSDSRGAWLSVWACPTDGHGRQRCPHSGTSKKDLTVDFLAIPTTCERHQVGKASAFLIARNQKNETTNYNKRTDPDTTPSGGHVLIPAVSSFVASALFQFGRLVTNPRNRGQHSTAIDLGRSHPHRKRRQPGYPLEQNRNHQGARNGRTG